MSAPATTGSASRFSAPYFVSGICCARRKMIVASIATIPQAWRIQRVSTTSAATSSASPSAPTVRAYPRRKARILLAVDRRAERRGERTAASTLSSGRAHDRAPHHDAVGESRHGARLLRAEMPKPTQTGSVVAARTRAMVVRQIGGDSSRSPVTPRRLMR